VLPNAGGVVAAAAAAALAYFTHYFRTNGNASQKLDFNPPFVHETAASRRWKWAGNIGHAFAIVAWLASMGLFVWGIFQAQDLLSSALTSAPAHHQGTAPPSR
jgi:hypothetical protein